MSRHEVDDRDWLELAQSTKVKDLLAAKPKQALRGLPILVDRSATIEETLQVRRPLPIHPVKSLIGSGARCRRSGTCTDTEMRSSSRTITSCRCPSWT